MKQSLTHHQEVVCRFLAQASANTKPEFYEAFMKACLLAMREQKIPVTLLCREVRRHMVRDKQYKAYALEVEGSAIGFKGSVGWKAIAADHAHPHNSEPAPASYLLSANKTEHVPPAQVQNNIVVLALLSKVKADLAAHLLGSGDGTPLMSPTPKRL